MQSEHHQAHHYSSSAETCALARSMRVFDRDALRSLGHPFAQEPAKRPRTSRCAHELQRTAAGIAPLAVRDDERQAEYDRVGLDDLRGRERHNETLAPNAAAVPAAFTSSRAVEECVPRGRGDSARHLLPEQFPCSEAERNGLVFGSAWLGSRWLALPDPDRDARRVRNTKFTESSLESCSV